MGRPGEIGIGQIQRLQHGGGFGHHTQAAFAGGASLLPTAQGGEGSLGVERRHYIIPPATGSSFRAEGVKPSASISRLAMIPMDGSFT